MSQPQQIMSSQGRFTRLFCICAVVLLAACAPRPTAQLAAPSPNATQYPVYVVTERELDQIGPSFGEPRNQGLRYFRAMVSVPPTHTVGQVEWPDPNRPANAETDFVMTDMHVFDERARFLQQVKQDRPGRETLLFVHGYNNTLSEATFRLAQMKADFDVKTPSVLFSWPSAGDPRGYVYDRDSILFARNDLETLIKQLAPNRNDKVFVLAHSMGSLLVMEAMRQAVIRGDRWMLDRLSGVAMMSPDMEPDLFRKQAETIGALPQPFLLFVSQEDRALGLASLISGSKPRLGVIDSPDAVEGLDVTVVDVTALGDDEGFNHAVAATSPFAIPVLREFISDINNGQRPSRQYVVLGGGS
ncbi:MAG: alpha/beta hydrolase [Roseovarius sp.]